MSSSAHAHVHDEDRNDSCCGGGGNCGNVTPATPAPSVGRSFQVSGLDCAEEVAILNKVVGPEVGGPEHLAFDVINGRMTVLDSATAVAVVEAQRRGS